MSRTVSFRLDYGGGIMSTPVDHIPTLVDNLLTARADGLAVRVLRMPPDNRTGYIPVTQDYEDYLLRCVDYTRHPEKLAFALRGEAQ